MATTDQQQAADGEAQIAAALEQLWAAGREATMERLEVVESTVAGLLLGDEITPTDGIAAAHKLAGTLGMFGLPGGSALAREVELLLESDTLDPDDLVRASELAAELRDSIESHGGPDGASGPGSNGAVGTAQGERAPATVAGSGSGGGRQATIVLVGGDRSYLEALAIGADQHRIEVQRHTVADLPADPPDLADGWTQRTTVVVDLATVVDDDSFPDLGPERWGSALRVAVGAGEELDARMRAATHHFDLVLSDSMPAERTIEILDQAIRLRARPATLLIVGHGDRGLATDLADQLPSWTIDFCHPEDLAEHFLERYRFVVVDVASLPDDLPAELLVRAIDRDRAELDAEVVVAIDSDRDGRQLLADLADGGTMVTTNDPVGLGRRLTTLHRRHGLGGRAADRAGSQPGHLPEASLDEIELDVANADDQPGSSGELAVVAVTPRWTDPEAAGGPDGGGETVRTRTARVLTSNFRRSDLKGRWGNTILVTANLDRARVLGRIRAVTGELERAGITVEVGLALLGRHGTTARELVDRAMADQSPTDHPVDPDEDDRRVLVVDDDDLVATLLDELLAAQGHEVDRLGDGTAAVEVLADPDRVADYRLVLLDVSLPGIDGFGILREMDRAGTRGLVPVVLLTARGSEAEMVCGLDLGAADYITKPFSPLILLRRLESAMSGGGSGSPSWP